ncbi:MAG: hypothetical protein ABIB98_03860 [bacterium]
MSICELKVRYPEKIDKYICIVSNSEKDVVLLVNKAKDIGLAVKQLEGKKFEGNFVGKNGVWVEITSIDDKEFAFTKLFELFREDKKQP